MRLVVTVASTRDDWCMQPRAVHLPWPTVTDFLVRSGSLVVSVAPDVDASTPGTAGLEQPEVLPMLRPRSGQRGFQYAVETLRPGLTAIAEALPHYCAGRLQMRFG
jgi:hypothetical protein